MGLTTIQEFVFEDYFLWSRTSQGWKYWNNLYNEFCTNEYT